MHESFLLDYLFIRSSPSCKLQNLETDIEITQAQFFALSFWYGTFLEGGVFCISFKVFRSEVVPPLLVTFSKNFVYILLHRKWDVEALFLSAMHSLLTLRC